MSLAQPAISVILSVYNTEKYLIEAIESILNKTFTVIERENTRKLDISGLVNGMYFIKIQTGSIIQMAKLMIEK